ncbi:M23 family metallopeptidase [Paragemmobacter straminiformis]|uniref:M23 family metallopeptidase n=1 Tax=Paragemmobacter straminiformis TaxID=2045119 RepID=A0A842IBS8_9RHOB|nr:M23 family metallopeptidase [Gemmobacter straminiformis]MBC2836807.1 M23 family metallopeptidase [Gemmobacter straminiformis]
MTIQTWHLLGKTALLLGTCALAACSGGTNPIDNLDWDLRGGNVMTTAAAARGVTAARPTPDGRGVISYPGYQVAVARRGDTPATVAARIGLTPAELASYNAVDANAPLRDGEVLALPRRVEGGAFAAAPGSAIGGGTVASAPLRAGSAARPGSVDVSSIATTALDRVDTAAPAAPAPATAAPAANLGDMAPTRHQVKRGETAFSIARTYGVSARALADWNGLGPDLDVREGQYLMIPTPTGAPPEAEAQPAQPAKVATSAPGAGTPTPTPPSAKQPLPAETPKTAAEVADSAPASPEMSQERTTASSAQFAMPVSGNIIRTYQPKKNEGIDIAAPAGTAVQAAAAGTVAAITQDTEQTPIIVIRHDGGLLTVYAGVAGIKVKKGDKVTRGQTIATVRSGNPAFLHFEVRRGVESTDPMPYLK